MAIKVFTNDSLATLVNETKTYVDDAVSTKANKSEGAFYIEGSGTTSSTSKKSTWTGTSDRITEYYDGLTIRYKIGVEGQSTVTLNINGLGAKTVYRFSTTKLTTHFPVGSIIQLIYHADLNGGCWVTNDYDANTNTYQRVYSSTTNVEYPITARYNTTTGETYYAEYGRYSTGVTLNPSTKTITASKFKGALVGNADTATSATKATQDASGNVITSTYETKVDAETKLNEANTYTDTAISNLINSAPSTLDTLGEIAAAMEENADVVEALDDAIGTKSKIGHKHTVSHTPAGSVSQPTFTGTAVTSGEPSGTTPTTTVASSSHTHKYTATGTVSKPSFTGTAASTTSISGTTSVYSITGVGSTPSLSASVANRCLTLSFNAGSVPTRSSVAVATDTHTHGYTPAGSVSQPTFTGTEATTTSISGTASVASSGHTHSVTASGTVSKPTFSGTAATLTTSGSTD